MSLMIHPFGKTKEGIEVKSYTLSHTDGTFCTLLSYGATVQKLLMPDRNGILQDIVLGYDDLASYERADNPYHGALIGRFANRIANACFELDGVTYHLAKNDGNNHLHGGIRGFNRVVWQAEPFETQDRLSVRFSYCSADGEEGYPGNLTAHVTYTLTDDHALMIQYEAISDKNTIINLTNHSYFNLAGHGSGPILDHFLKIEADEITAINDECLPDGRIIAVEGTAFDFRDLRRIGNDIDGDDPQMKAGKGYDHNFIIRGPIGTLRPCARLLEPKSGRMMTVETTQPGVQFYSGNFLKPDKGKKGACYDFRSGLCLETQNYPNAPNIAHFPSCVLKAGELYKHTTVYRFLTASKMTFSGPY